MAWMDSPFFSTSVRFMARGAGEKALVDARLPTWQPGEEQVEQNVELVPEVKEPAGQGVQSVVEPVILEKVPFWQGTQAVPAKEKLPATQNSHVPLEFFA